jgi:DSF synthase
MELFSPLKNPDAGPELDPSNLMPQNREYIMNAEARATVASLHFIHREYTEITTHIDHEHELAWCYMNPASRACFTTQLLDDLNRWSAYVRANAANAGIKYHIIASRVSGTFNLGGDLDLFRHMVLTKDRVGLLDYGTACISALYANVTHFDQDVTTISLVQGEALGGGFETALSSDVIIAERGSRMGFPEVLFNLFPGMGAYSLLSRRLDPKRAERMILSGTLYTAEDLFGMGLVDLLVDPGEGERTVYEYIKRENRARNGFRSLRQVRDLRDPITYEELTDVLQIWVDATMKLERRDLRMMERLVARQLQQGAKAA